ncbi:hypothetical protein BDV28DRAFT_128469 [Aspergillus coremiiformis]|uniref:Major facilitator superfamily (MFS) profile domain-containing protein n=1 Tax=Aspergillus coremiiformis TaxID=138285 RepID=A0A5N6ZEV0_9EURO|nr:hypothetical protein BDV28DRAFT_128469 [Aspergillus coremiiformis]
MHCGVYFFIAALSFLAFFTSIIIPETSSTPLEAVNRLFKDEQEPVDNSNAETKP